MSLTLKFPPLEKMLVKDTSELEPDDPKCGVCVYNENAIVVMDQAIVFFNLSDYFINEMGFKDQNQLRDLRDILSFMDGKMFSASFWKELTQTNSVSLTPEGLNLNGVINKDIYYNEKSFDNTEIRMVCKGMLNHPPVGKKVNAIYIAPLLAVIGALRSMVKNDSIVVRTVGESTPIQFTFDENPWIYGILMPDTASASKNFMFDPLEGYAKDFD